MPITRSNSNPPRQPLQSHQSNAENAIIVVSSDDEGTRQLIPRKRPRKTAKQQGKAMTRTPLAIPEDVVEISSDDDDDRRPSSSSKLAALEKQLKALKVENERLKQRQRETIPPEAHAASESVRANELELEKYKNLMGTLDDNMSCDICTGKMWLPSTLMCGHTFCRSCLQDWFSTALMKHLTSHPNYTMHTPRMRQLAQTMKHAHMQPQHRRILELDALAEFERQPQPDYTCPACRVLVRNRPLEVFALKDVVRTVANTAGERSPKKAQPTANRGKKIDGPWDGFFPNITA